MSILSSSYSSLPGQEPYPSALLSSSDSVGSQDLRVSSLSGSALSQGSDSPPLLGSDSSLSSASSISNADLNAAQTGSNFQVYLGVALVVAGLAVFTLGFVGLCFCPAAAVPFLGMGLILMTAGIFFVMPPDDTSENQTESS